MTKVINLEDLDSNEYVRLVLADAHDDVSEEQAASLRSNEGVREWRDALLELAAQAQSKLARLNADLLTKEQECRTKGPIGKIEYFKLKAKTEKEKVKTNSYHQKILTRLREAKAIVHETSQNEQLGLRGLMEDLSKRLDLIEKLLKELLRRTS